MHKHSGHSEFSRLHMLCIPVFGSQPHHKFATEAPTPGSCRGLVNARTQHFDLSLPKSLGHKLFSKQLCSANQECNLQRPPPQTLRDEFAMTRMTSRVVLCRVTISFKASMCEKDTTKNELSFSNMKLCSISIVYSLLKALECCEHACMWLYIGVCMYL